MFVAITRLRIRPGFEDQFRQAWQRLTEAAKDRCGSGGAALLQAQDGSFVAIARWKTGDDRDACLAPGPLDCEAQRLYDEAVLSKDESLDLAMVKNLWSDFTRPVLPATGSFG